MKGIISHETLLQRTVRKMHKEANRDTDNLATLEDTIAVASDKEINNLLGVVEDDPQNYREATQAYNAAEWDISYNDELKSMAWDGVWTLISCFQFPKGCCILGSHTIFLRKHDKNNNVSQHKTRIISKGTIMTPFPQLHISNPSELF